MAITSRPGDILYWKLFKSRSFPFGHAGIVWNGDGDTWCIQVADGMVVKTQIGHVSPEPHRVFQCDDSWYAAEAASVAHIWAMKMRDPHDPRQAGITGGRQMGSKMAALDGQYGFATSVLSAVAKTTYGPKARGRASTYRQYSRNIQGPPSFRGGAWRSHLFCSMFVVAAYQGASASDREVNQFMQLDAKYTSPHDLQNYLFRNAHWERGNWDDY
jgi:hypothetical protein